MTDDLRAALYSCKAILVKLQQIPDAPTGRLHTGPKPPKYADSRVPEGVRLNGSVTPSAPSKQFSLYGHYAYRMKRASEARDASTLLRLAACATRDYEIHAHIRPPFHENHEAAVTELIRDCRGVPALEAAWQLGAPEKWIRRQRVLHGYDAEMGEPRDRSEQVRRVFEMRARHMKQREIAVQLGITQQRVSQILAGERAA